MADSDQVKAALTALADGEIGCDDDGKATRRARWDDGSVRRETADEADCDADYRVVIERAAEATSDLDDAVTFVEAFGVGRLETAVAQAEYEVSGLADEGRAALREFRRYRDAATMTDDEL